MYVVLEGSIYGSQMQYQAKSGHNSCTDSLSIFLGISYRLLKRDSFALRVLAEAPSLRTKYSSISKRSIGPLMQDVLRG